MRHSILAAGRQHWLNRSHNKPRRGAIIVLAAMLMIAMMAMLALSIDTGYMYTMQSELDRAVDSAALAGAGALVDGIDAAEDQAIEYLVRNPVGSSHDGIESSSLATVKAGFLNKYGEDLDIDWGHWNSVTGQIDSTNILPSAVQVTMRYPNLPLFFGRALGKNSFAIQSQAIAMYQPRDMMLVLDLSASMNDDSEFGAIPDFGKEEIMYGLQQMYEELGSPTYGNMQFEPQYITVYGDPPSDGSMPQISVTYAYDSVHITSTKDLSNVVLEYEDGKHQKFEGISGLEGDFRGTGEHKGKRINCVWVKSGNNPSGEGPGYGESFHELESYRIRDTIKTALGLDSVAYPYQSGSWESFIDYCRNNSSNRRAEFKYKFGYANLINYWLEQKPRKDQTADLWKVSAQPITAVKDSVDVFIDYVTYVDTDDRLGLAVYNASNGEGALEIPLTLNITSIADKARTHQAGNYHNYTNIGAGLEAAREQLDQHGRPGAFKMIVLMTDGQANWNNGSYNTTAAREHLLTEASAAAANRYPVVTISLGAGADTALMNQVAEITDSRHFNIPGEQTVDEYRDGLMQVFRDIADARPMKLVH